MTGYNKTTSLADCSLENRLKSYTRCLSIAGSDPSGGAGLQADLKTFSALGCYGMTAVVAVVDENTVGVTGVHPIPVDFVTGQIRSCLDDIGADAIKIGMLHSKELILAVKETLHRYPGIPVVLDPVMVATSGDPLLQSDAIATLRECLIPTATVITPNIPEAQILLGRKLTSSDELPDAARELSQGRKVSVFLKAGHLEENTLTDILYDASTDTIHRMVSSKILTVNTHGTGCTLSSAIASFLAKGNSLPDACRMAKAYISEAIASGAAYAIGHGHGPVNHFHSLWP